MSLRALDREHKLEILERVLWPLAKFCVRHFYSFQDILNIFKTLLLRAAAEEILRSGKKVNVSRLSVSTGLHRGEVQRLYKDQAPKPDESLSILTRVIGQWRHDSRFSTRAGQPRVLSYQGEDSEFKALANSVSTTVHSGTIFSELERMGAIERTARGLRLKIQTGALGGDAKRTCELLGNDLDSLITSVEENLEGLSHPGNLHIRTEYDNIYIASLPEIREWLLEEGKSFHRRARNFISQFDRDLSSAPAQLGRAGGRVVLSAFSLTDPPGHKVDPSS